MNKDKILNKIKKQYFKLGKAIFERRFRAPTKTAHEVLTERYIMNHTLDSYMSIEEQKDFFNNTCWEIYVNGWRYASKNPSIQYYKNCNPTLFLTYVKGD